jgi:hypothetical protein
MSTGQLAKVLRKRGILDGKTFCQPVCFDYTITISGTNLSSMTSVRLGREPGNAVPLASIDMAWGQHMQ